MKPLFFSGHRNCMGGKHYMELTARHVRQNLQENLEIKDLMARSFPKNERFSFQLQKFWALFPGNDSLAFYDGNLFAGIMQAFATDEAVFILYLAVNDRIRSHGYGSRILSWAKEHYQDRCITLNVEPEDDQAPNREQRRRRMEFYRKNGITDTGYIFHEGGDTYSVLSTNAPSAPFTPEKFRKATGKLTFGLYTPKIIKKTEVR